VTDLHIGKWELLKGKCPKCGGALYLFLEDYYEYAKCLMCSRKTLIEKEKIDRR
jgi:ssDNA-binding Zn-finger/Zn-ribbon topoisomerase 1